MKNHALKTRPAEKPYEIWAARGWEWHVLKKWQVDDAKPFARWFCLVKSPFTPTGELGDTYVNDITAHATLVYRDPDYAILINLPTIDDR